MIRESDFVKLRVMVPLEAGERVRQALGAAGAGVQGAYSFCSGTYRQTGRFKPEKGARPAVGEIGRLESVEEEVIETICPKDILEKVLQAVRQAHPYEEPAIDILPRLEIY
ncbi:MAG: hypothetical protein UY92_C0015G0048 [Candidatus Magasanikbacteria bacterium GW2011_GWA2_56_11]|uniref:Uncharacterized protein n=1 Tax=Candidatus Magasanikbacteria bacterium GW2011_GWA2_56_11 TaxID=1619044 RepID=A0A0G1YEK0_9BACT|nr:MAG: hypothetical protein UY92_C0015G0048 [Candidatus Magasanikbacteria bacterium GW2011_GWA2_56_11]